MLQAGDIHVQKSLNTLLTRSRERLQFSSYPIIFRFRVQGYSSGFYLFRTLRAEAFIYLLQK
jgi:hypothetical protein